MSELKPCPFCGGEAKTWADRTDFYVACYKCHIDMSSGKPTEAIEAWNRRAQPAQVGQVLTRDDIVDAWMAVMHIVNATRRQEAFARAIEQAVLAKRVPMTDEQLASIYIDWDAKAGSTFAELMRAVERHHGIVGEKGGA